MMENFFENMIMRDLGQRFSRARSDDAPQARDMPNAANQVQYPKEFYNSVPVITAVPLVKHKINTIILATQSPGYTQESFNTDVRKTAEYFELEPSMYVAILLLPSHEGLNVLDSADAADKLRRVVDMMNSSTVLLSSERSDSSQLPTGETRHVRQKEEIIITTSSAYTIRIVSLGVKSSSFIFTALEYVVNHWLAPQKYVQFITNGEIADEKFIKFWTSACINEMVKVVQFVNLNCYQPFGYYDGSCKKLNKTGQWNTGQSTERSAVNLPNKPSITD